MAINVEKSLYQAPEGLDALMEDPVDVEIEVEVEPADGIEEEDIEAEPEDFDANLAEVIPETELNSISSDLIGFYEADLRDRKEWLDIYIKGLKLLGLKPEEKTEPWKGACAVQHPLLMESAVKFQSETIMETFPASGPVKTKIIGKETQEKRDAARRVADDMNHQLTEVMEEYRPEHERMLFALCLSGNAFKKIYADPALRRQVSNFVPAEDIIVPYGATSLWSAERITHRMRKTKNDLRKLQVAKFYRDIDLGEPTRDLDEVEKEYAKEQGFTATTDHRYQLLEMQVDLDLAGYEDKDEKGNKTGIALPYVVTIEKGSGKILAIRRNWLEEDPLKLRRQHFVHYGYIPGFGFYCYGLIHLIGGHTKGATSLLQQLIDAGTLANLPGGLKTRGLRVKNDDQPIGPGEFRDVDVPAGTVRDNIMTLPYKEPSVTLVGLMDKLVEDGRRLAATADLKASDMSAQAPVGTTLAILERVLKVMSAVQARIHAAMKREFRLLAAIIRDNTSSDYSYDPESGDRSAKQGDYDLVNVIPVSDPNATTMSQRVVQYQAVHQLASTAPQIYDLPYLHRQMIETLGIKNAEKIVPMADDLRPVDPVNENMDIMMGKPVKAFIEQDHEAHLAVHTSFLQDPKFAAMIGQMPQAQAMQAAASAHIMEHIAYQYRREIEKQLGAALPPYMDQQDNKDDPQPLPPPLAAQLAQLTAAAASQLLQKDAAEAQAQQAAQQAQDPLYQLQLAELEVKKGENKRKEKKDIIDAALKAYQIETTQEIADDNRELKGAELGVKIRDSEVAAATKQSDVQNKLSIALLSQLTSLAGDEEDEEDDSEDTAGDTEGQ